MYKVSSDILLEVLAAEKAIGKLTPEDLRKDPKKFLNGYGKLWKIARKIEANYDLKGIKR